MSSWKELCETYDKPDADLTEIQWVNAELFCLFDNIRAVVEAAKQVSDSHQGQDDTAELGYLNITLRELGAIP